MVALWSKTQDEIARDVLPENTEIINGFSTIFPALWYHKISKTKEKRDELAALIDIGVVGKITLHTQEDVGYFDQYFTINLEEFLPLVLDLWCVPDSYDHSLKMLMHGFMLFRILEAEDPILRQTNEPLVAPPNEDDFKFWRASAIDALGQALDEQGWYTKTITDKYAVQTYEPIGGSIRKNDPKPTEIKVSISWYEASIYSR